MLKKKLTKDEALSLANEFGLEAYIRVNELIESLQMARQKETKVCLITTNNEVVENILSECGCSDPIINKGCIAKIKIRYGNEQFTAITDYGEMYVDNRRFVEFLKAEHERIEGWISQEKWQNILLEIHYVPEYVKIDDDTWRCIMMSADKLILVLDGTRLLYTAEQDFIKTLVLPHYTGGERMQLVIGNAQRVKSSEWPDMINRIQLILEETYEVIPFFTEQVPDKQKQRYANHEKTLDTVLKQTQVSALQLRKEHHHDLDAYAESVLEHELQQLKQKMMELQSRGTSETRHALADEESISRSREHLMSSVSLFLESPLLARSREAINRFARLFKESLKEDIDASENIKQDARMLTNYLSAVWEQFILEQNQLMRDEFEREADMLIMMMTLDIKHFAEHIQDSDIRQKIKRKLAAGMNVNTFFARKTSVGNELTDALTIGGLISTVFISPLGILAVAVSEVIKVANKDSMNNEFKAELKKKIDEVIDRNRNDIISLAEKRFTQISRDFQEEIMKFYDNILESVRQTISREEAKAAKATEIIEQIENLI